jgi:hypothetical protein
MSSNGKTRPGVYSAFSIICVVIVAAVVSLVIQIAMIFPLDYAFRGHAVRCSDVKQGMTFGEIRKIVRGKVSPQEMYYSGDRLQIWNGEDACTIYLDQKTDRVLKIEKSFPPLTL